MKAFILGVLVTALFDYAGVMDAASVVVLLQSLAQTILTWVTTI